MVASSRAVCPSAAPSRLSCLTSGSTRRVPQAAFAVLFNPACDTRGLTWSLGGEPPMTIGSSRLFLCLVVSIIALLTLAVWNWVTWPQRTANAFAKALSEGRIADAKKLWDASHYGYPADGFADSSKEPKWWRSDPVADRRSWQDVVYGRQHFNGYWPVHNDLEVIRGRVVLCCTRCTVQYFPPPPIFPLPKRTAMAGMAPVASSSGVDGGGSDENDER